MIESILRTSYPETFSFIDRAECGLSYSPQFREFQLAVRPRSLAVQLLGFCPFSGRAFPASLRNIFFNDLEALGLTDGFEDIEKAPLAYHSERWWIDRRL